MWSQEPTALDVPIHMGALGYGLVKGSDSFAATPTTPLVPLPGMGPTGYPRRQQIATSNGPEGATDLGVYAAVTGLGAG